MMTELSQLLPTDGLARRPCTARRPFAAKKRAQSRMKSLKQLDLFKLRPFSFIGTVDSQLLGRAKLSISLEKGYRLGTQSEFPFNLVTNISSCSHFCYRTKSQCASNGHSRSMLGRSFRAKQAVRGLAPFATSAVSALQSK